MTVAAAREAYPRWAATYEHENAVTTLECELVERLSRSPRGLRLLDVGCGTGRRLVGSGAASATGVEACPEMLAAGRQAHSFGPEVRLLEGDARALPVPAGAFELVWCRLMIGHLPECEAAYRELGRAAAAGGQVVVTDFHPDAYAAGLRRTFRDGEEVLEIEHYVHTAETQIAAAEKAGLVLSAAAEGVVGPQVRGFYSAAGKAAMYEQQRGRPLVLGLAFRRDA
uniref:class I SAM-dependent methyltransferase n=1 Tax=Altererythrobacter segetis TaxID=1104773 RepID=UPI00140CC574|nr:class I SAM-dependent methyltransferase [Altererythrobacter segetis]